MKPIAVYRTYNTSDCAATGYRFFLYPNGRIAIENRTRWQGTRTDRRWISEAGRVDFRTAAELKEWANDRMQDGDHPADERDFRLVRNGYIVR